MSTNSLLIIKRLVWAAIIILLIVLVSVIIQLKQAMDEVGVHQPGKPVSLVTNADSLWSAPLLSELTHDEEGELVLYGRELIEHTATYLGPEGKVGVYSNGMNCQNCHLQAGTKPFGNNYSAVASTYPKFRHRSGTVEGIGKRINDCIERSLNGRPLPENSREIRAIVAYMIWLGKEVPHGRTPKGAGLVPLEYIERPANPQIGRNQYALYCASCHGSNGEGVKHSNGVEWVYPPLWGDNSYNTGAGLYRLSKLAAFIRTNMPYGISYEQPVLPVADAWDIAAYINSMPRPHKEFAGDWPDLAHKPVDHPFGPYVDGLSEIVHKYGPFPKSDK